jgi:hypothetical protein
MEKMDILAKVTVNKETHVALAASTENMPSALTLAKNSKNTKQCYA